jgi:hypothetical protein
MKYLQQTHILNALSLALDTILEVCGNFKRWGLAEGNKSVGAHLCNLHQVPFPVSFSCILVTMMWLLLLFQT